MLPGHMTCGEDMQNGPNPATSKASADMNRGDSIQEDMEEEEDNRNNKKKKEDSMDDDDDEHHSEKDDDDKFMQLRSGKGFGILVPWLQ